MAGRSFVNNTVGLSQTSDKIRFGLLRKHWSEIGFKRAIADCSWGWRSGRSNWLLQLDGTIENDWIRSVILCLLIGDVGYIDVPGIATKLPESIIQNIIDHLEPGL